MSKRAKEAAMEAYPVVLDNVTVGFNFSVEEDINSYPRRLFQEGYESAEKDLGWHSVEESLPPIDEEVIVLTNEMHGHILSTACHLCYGHIVDQSIAIDYNGWNIPGVKFWMPCPKIPEK